MQSEWKSSMDRPWYAPRPPGEVTPKPWLHESAVSYFAQILWPQFVVLEHGAGGSTLWLAERVARVVSIEHDPAWAATIKAKAPPTVRILSYLPMLECEGYNLFFIDGARDERGKCLLLADSVVAPAGWVVLDNANRPEYAQEREHLRKCFKLMRRFDNNQPHSSYFVTEFWQRCG
jgi:predicted O-methyltransferase YrrM